MCRPLTNVWRAQNCYAELWKCASGPDTPVVVDDTVNRVSLRIFTETLLHFLSL